MSRGLRKNKKNRSSFEKKSLILNFTRTHELIQKRHSVIFWHKQDWDTIRIESSAPQNTRKLTQLTFRMPSSFTADILKSKVNLFNFNEFSLKIASSFCNCTQLGWKFTKLSMNVQMVRTTVCLEFGNDLSLPPYSTSQSRKKYVSICSSQLIHLNYAKFNICRTFLKWQTDDYVISREACEPPQVQR